VVYAAIIILKDTGEPTGEPRHRSRIASLLEFQLLDRGVVLPFESAVADLLLRQDVSFLLERPKLGRRMVPVECPGEQLAAHLGTLCPLVARVALAFVHSNLKRNTVHSSGLGGLLALKCN